MTLRPSELGPWSETDILECALSWLQDTDDPTLRRSALGSRLSLHLAERTPEADQRDNLAEEGVRFAEAAIALGADGDGAVHYYLAANLGLVIRDHVTLAMENLPRLQSEMQRAVDLSPEIDDGGPLRLLGILYLKAPPWPTGFGDSEKAFDLLQSVVEKHPPHPLNHLFYAEVLWEADESSPVERIEAELATGMRLLAEAYKLQPSALEKRARPVSGRYRGIGAIDPIRDGRGRAGWMSGVEVASHTDSSAVSKGPTVSGSASASCSRM